MSEATGEGRTLARPCKSRYQTRRQLCFVRYNPARNPRNTGLLVGASGKSLVNRDREGFTCETSVNLATHFCESIFRPFLFFFFSFITPLTSNRFCCSARRLRYVARMSGKISFNETNRGDRIQQRARAGKKNFPTMRRERERNSKFYQ